MNVIVPILAAGRESAVNAWSTTGGPVSCRHATSRRISKKDMTGRLQISYASTTKEEFAGTDLWRVIQPVKYVMGENYVINY